MESFYSLRMHFAGNKGRCGCTIEAVLAATMGSSAAGERGKMAQATPDFSARQGLRGREPRAAQRRGRGGVRELVRLPYARTNNNTS